jgi:hypothetical protein
MAQKALKRAASEFVTAMAQTVTDDRQSLEQLLRETRHGNLRRRPTSAFVWRAGCTPTLRMLFELAFPHYPADSMRVRVNMGVGVSDMF